eukprot:scaffold3554_cov61-Phaeocystis_antarctica.AAC.3
MQIESSVTEMIGLVSFWREADTWRESVRPLRRFTPLPDGLQKAQDHAVTGGRDFTVLTHAVLTLGCCSMFSALGHFSRKVLGSPHQARVPTAMVTTRQQAAVFGRVGLYCCSAEGSRYIAVTGRV